MVEEDHWPDKSFDLNREFRFVLLLAVKINNRPLFVLYGRSAVDKFVQTGHYGCLLK